jgi:hypothetical protein
MVGYVLGGPVVAAPGLIAATVAGAAVVVMLSACLAVTTLARRLCVSC